MAWYSFKTRPDIPKFASNGPHLRLVSQFTLFSQELLREKFSSFKKIPFRLLSLGIVVKHVHLHQELRNRMMSLQLVIGKPWLIVFLTLLMTRPTLLS